MVCTNCGALAWRDTVARGRARFCGLGCLVEYDRGGPRDTHTFTCPFGR